MRDKQPSFVSSSAGSGVSKGVPPSAIASSQAQLSGSRCCSSPAGRTGTIPRLVPQARQFRRSDGQLPPHAAHVLVSTLLCSLLVILPSHTQSRMLVVAHARVLLTLNQQQRNHRAAHHPVGDAAQQPAAESRVSPPGHDDQIDLILFSETDDLDAGFALDGFGLNREPLLPQTSGDAFQIDLGQSGGSFLRTAYRVPSGPAWIRQRPQDH
jgi:hypothetical protein